MNLKLPESAKIGKTIPKKKFFEKMTNSKEKRDFDKIAKIIWSYNLSPKTVNLNGTDTVEEIQIFTIILKIKEIPIKAINVINKLIPYPILFFLKFGDEELSAVKCIYNNKFFFSNWNEELVFEFSGSDLEEIYKNIIMSFFDLKLASFEESLNIQTKIDFLKKEITSVENKLKKEKQFKFKVELNKKLINLKKELTKIKTQFV